MTKTIEQPESTSSSTTPVGVHLVGSVPLGSAEEVFRRASAALGDRLRRIPDGETGPRSDWILWQYPGFSARPQSETAAPGDGPDRTIPNCRPLRGASPADVTFESLG